MGEIEIKLKNKHEVIQRLQEYFGWHSEFKGRKKATPHGS